MEESDPRAVLDRLIAERGGDYAGLSRLLGRNPAYIQQFIKRGTPKRLAEADRRKLAEFFDIEETLLGGPPSRSGERAGGGLVAVGRYDVSASAGPGAMAGEDRELSRLAFAERWLRGLAGDPGKLSIIAVKGDSMEPS
ncbi:MAG: peptidase S24, partial [Sphingomonadales bacterium]|nr:peptidase S24 [Sphingomonadales bacterium]